MSEYYDDAPHQFRENITYVSLRKQSSRIFSNIKKKVSAIDESVRQRRALKPLNESPSPQRLSPKSRNNKINRELQGYHFDEESNLLTTPPRSEPKKLHKFKGHPAQFGRKRVTTNDGPYVTVDTPTSSRLAKSLAACKISEVFLTRPRRKGTPLVTPKTPRLKKMQRMISFRAKKLLS